MHTSVCVLCLCVSSLGLILVWFGFTIGKTHTHMHMHTHVARPHACTIHPPHLAPVAARSASHEQIASLWSPPPRRAIHVCITIFQHI